MIKSTNLSKVIFYILLVLLLITYLFPGSLIGLVVYGSKKIQPQITPDFIISSNHFYVFVLVSIIGFLTFTKANQIKVLIVYLLLISLVLELLHLIIPQRTFQWSDLFGNLVGVIVVILISNLINKYGVFKK